MPNPPLLRALLLLLAGATSLVGCSYANAPLNGEHVLLENRKVNQTRSAVFGDVSPPPATQDSASMLQPEHVVRTPASAKPGPDDADGYFVGLALSGGGSRSANFAAAAMFQLQRLGLLQHVDYISSVSGGSLAAAYYCSTRAWDPGSAQRALSYPFAGDMLVQSLLPWNIAAYMLTDWDRSDVLAGIFRERLFNRDSRPLTYAELRPDRPRLLVNATDLQSGRRFVFCNETFDVMNSDLSRYPLAYAVAASSAVPVVLHPVTLRNFATTFPQYCHLIDGGVIDNLGAQTLVDTYASQIGSARKSGRPDPYPHGAVFIIVSAQTRFNERLSDRSDTGAFTSLKAAMGLTSRSLVNRASSATLAEIIVNNAADEESARQLREQIRQLDNEGFLRLIDRGGHPVRVIYISLAQLEGLTNLPFVSFAEDVNSIETYYSITSEQAASLYQAADLIVRGKIEANVREVAQEIESTTKTP